jgi:gamma-glutamyltranspeptidase/glutathione hydrolase
MPTAPRRQRRGAGQAPALVHGADHRARQGDRPLCRRHRLAGGTAIVGYVVKALVGILDWKMSPQDAVALPNLVAMGNKYSADKFPDDITSALAARGEVLDSGRGENSGLQAIVYKPKGAIRYVGGADPRREGIARGF